MGKRNNIPLGNPEYFSILGSGIDSFEGEKSYYSTSSIQGVEIGEPEEIITYEVRPSRANMQPIVGSVGFAKMAKTLKVLKIDEEFAEKTILSTGFALIYGNPEKVDSSYLRYFFLSSQFNSEKDRLSTGTTQVAINQKGIEKIEVPLFDLSTQQLIVSEIEKQFSRLDEGLSSLSRIRENLKSYRASLLKSAVEGRLTAEWRADHPDIEHADVLLDHIHTARGEKWMKENPGKKYKEIDEIGREIDGVEIPDIWKWSSFGDLIFSGPQNGIYKPSTAYGEGISILRIDDYQNTYIKSKKELRLLNITDSEIELYGLDEFDLVINRVNSMTHLGKSVVIPKTILPCVFESNMMRIKLSPYLSIKYIEFFLHSYIGIKQLQKNAKQAVNQASINQQDVKDVTVPLPPLLEQHRIVEILEERFSVIDSMETLIDANIRRAENLKQAILKKAFSGELII
ncbi:MAG: hypothetical protein HHAS10_06290 [Candidatus Altimarinota bacterium]